MIIKHTVWGVVLGSGIYTLKGGKHYSWGNSICLRLRRCGFLNQGHIDPLEAGRGHATPAPLVYTEGEMLAVTKIRLLFELLVWGGETA